jgi:hypothetical protein
MVLDGVIDPTRVFYFSNLDQDTAFDVASKVWFDWIARHDDTYDLGTTASAVAARYYALRSSLKAHPVDGKIGPSEFDDIFLGAGYAQFLWPILAGPLSQAAHGDVNVLLGGFPGPGDDNGYATYAATECTDAPWAPSWSRWRQDSERYYRTSPFLTWANTWFNAPCFFWHVAATKRVQVNGNGVAPILLVSQTLDAATPYAGALRTRSLFGNSALIAEPGGTTHAGSLFGNECTDGLIADYLATGALPARQGGQRADAICQPLPEPEPFVAGPPASTSGSARARLYRLGMAR